MQGFYFMAPHRVSMVKKLLSIAFLSSFSASALAVVPMNTDCQKQSDNLSASYHFERAAAHKTGVSTVGLWRYQGRVAQVSPAQNIISIWYKTQESRIKLDRLFTEFNRGIEYQPADYRGKITDWKTKYQLIPENLLTQLKVKSTSGSGCELVEHRVGEVNGKKHDLYWMPKLKLVKEHTMSDKRSKLHITLKDLSLTENKVKAQFDKWDSYKMIDYADVGDTESDPFVAKMINMGFVKHGAGFYNSDGTAIEGGHGHAGHGHHGHNH